MKYLLVTLLFLPLCGLAQILPEPPPPPPIPSPGSEPNKIQDFPEKEASYPGGSEALMKDIQKHIVYPDSAIKNNIQGRVYVSFVVEKDGSLTQVKILRGIGHGCDEAAIRAIKKLKKWNPAENEGRPVRQLIRLPVVFKLK